MHTVTNLGSSPISTNGRSTGTFCHFLTVTMLVASAGDGVAEPTRADLESYAECAASATTHMLDSGEARRCADAYLRIKLSFLSGISPDHYKTLPPLKRAKANEAGYAAYLNWKLTYVGSLGEPATPADGKKSGSGW